MSILEDGRKKLTEKAAHGRIKEPCLVIDPRSDWCYATSEAVSLDLSKALYCPYCDSPLTKFEQTALSRCIDCLEKP